MMSLMTVMACSKEENEIIPRQADEVFFTMPQGDNDFDVTIMDMHNKYGFYPVYKFEPGDIYWGYSTWIEFRRSADWNHKGDLKYTPAEEAYIGDLLNLFNEIFVNRVSESSLEHMPIKLLFCSELFLGEVKGGMVDGEWVTSDVYTPRYVMKGYDYLAIPYGNDKAKALTPQEKLHFSSSVMSVFAGILLEKGVIKIPEEFSAISADYYVSDRSPYSYDVFKKGFLNGKTTGYEHSLQDNISKDFGNYINLVLEKSLDYLVSGAFESLGSYNRDPSLSGVLNPNPDSEGKVRDEDGLVRKKYDMVAKLLKDVGIDVDYYQDPF